MMQGAFETGKYPNYLAEVGISDAQAREKISKAFDTIFFDPEENFYHEHDTDPESRMQDIPLRGDIRFSDTEAGAQIQGMLKRQPLTHADIYAVFFQTVEKVTEHNALRSRDLHPS